MATSKKKQEKPTPGEIDRDLDEALKQTFPASDPTSVGQPTGAKPPPAPGEPLRREKRQDEEPLHEEEHEKAEKHVEKQTTVEPEERSVVPGPPVPPEKQKEIKKHSQK